MKKANYFIIFIGLLILTGCRERELTIDRVYPDTTILEKVREKNERELKEKEIREKSLVVRLNEKKITPRSLELSSPNDASGYTANPTQYCWALIPGECELMQPIHPDDNKTPYYSLYYLRVAANEKIYIGIGESVGEILVPLPTRVEAYIYDENKNLHLHETIDNPGKNIEITPPSNSGSYIFLFKVIYSDEAEGISYHSHGITVISEQ